MTSGPSHSPDVAEWRLIYDVLLEMKVGDVIRYDALDEVLGRSFKDEGAKRSPLERARRELEEKDHRTLAVVRRVGYRMVAAQEHMRLAREHQTRSWRQTTKAKEKLSATDLAALTAFERRRLDEMQLQISHLISAHRRSSRQLEHIDRLLDTVRHKSGTENEELRKSNDRPSG